MAGNGKLGPQYYEITTKTTIPAILGKDSTANVRKYFLHNWGRCKFFTSDIPPFCFQIPYRVTRNHVKTVQLATTQTLDSTAHAHSVTMVICAVNEITAFQTLALTMRHAVVTALTSSATVAMVILVTFVI